MTVKTTKLGPGTFTLELVGTGGTVVDASCQVESLSVPWSKDKADDVRMLCGDVKPGATTYTAQITGTVDQDLADPAGLVFFTWANKGQQANFVYTPNNDAGATVTGVVTIDPLTVGDDTGGEDMTSDFTWDCVGEPQLAPAPPADFAADLADAA
jgi:hypothetical protein